jgi:hypothetical protein
MTEIDIPKEFDFAIAGTIQHIKAPQRWGGTGKKRCSLGKSCRSTCIQRGLVCRVELSPYIADSLGRFIKVKRSGEVEAHPNLKIDFNRNSIMSAIRNLKTLDPDAPRRVEVLQRIFNKTKTLFMDWKDIAGNKKAFREAFSKHFKNPDFTISQKIYQMGWGGLAYREGVTVVKSSPGFNPQVKKIKTAAEKHLSNVAQGKEIPHTVGKAPGSPSNNSLVTLVHELGHQAHFKAKEVGIPKSFKKFSIYSDTDHLEHYAELFSAYIFAGPKMKKLFPAEYELVETVLKKGNLLR